MARARKTIAQRRQKAGQGDLKFSISTEPPISSLIRLYEEMGGIYKDWKEPLGQEVGPVIAKGMRVTYDSRGASLNDAWPRPRAKYSRRKLRDGFGSTPMVRTGKTRRHLDTKAARVSLTKTSVSIGWRGRRFKHVPSLNFGGFNQAEHPMAGWSDKMKLDANTAIVAWLNARISETSRSFNRLARRKAA